MRRFIAVVCVCGLVFASTGCNRDRMADNVVGPAAEWMAHMRSGLPYPSHIRFHQAPAVGQWARYRQGETVVSWEILETHATNCWVVESLILFVADTELVAIRLVVDAEGQVHEAEAQLRVFDADGVSLSDRQPLRLTLGAPVASLPEKIELRDSFTQVAGLATQEAAFGRRRFWFSPAAYFGTDCQTKDGKARGGLVRAIAHGGSFGRELLAQGQH